MPISNTAEIQNALDKLWVILLTNPNQVVDDATEILRNMRTINRDNSTAHSSGAIIVLEFHALHLLGHAYLNSNSTLLAQTTAEELRTLSEKVHNAEYFALAESIIAKIEIQQVQWQAAKQRLTRILPVLEEAKNHEFTQAVLIDLSTIEQSQNNYEASMRLLLRAEAESQKHPVNTRISRAIMANLADVYMRLGNLDKAIDYITISLHKTKEAKDFQNYSNALLRLSNIYSRQGDTAKQIAALQESIEVLIPQNLQYQIAIQRIALGTAYMDMGDFTWAVDEFQQALPILTQEKDRKNIAILHQRMGVLFSHSSFQERDSIIAQSHFLLAEELALELSMPHFRAAVLECRSESYASFGLFEEAYQMLQRSTTLEKEILNETTLQQIRELEVRYDIALKEKENELLAAQNRTLALERNHLQTQLTMNNQSILIQMNELNTFRKEVLSITKQLDRAENIVRKVKNKLRESPVMQDSWGSYLETFTKVHPDFQATLLAAYPDLTAMEMKVCILIRAGLQTEEISQILSLSARTIENHRFNLRKKLHVGERENLAKFLMNI